MYFPNCLIGRSSQTSVDGILKTSKRTQTALILVPAGFFIYFAYIHISTGGRLTYFAVQKAVGWDLAGANPLMVIYDNPVRPQWMFQFFGALFSSLGLLALVASFRRLRFSHFVAGVLLILVSMCSGQAKLLSMRRFVIVVFPLMIACTLGTWKRSADSMLTVMLALIRGFLIFLWFPRKEAGSDRNSSH